MQYLFPHGRERHDSRAAALSDTIIRYWTTFPHHGGPNGAGLPEWPRFTTPGTVLSLAPNAIRLVDYAQEHRLAFWKQIGV